MVTLRSKEYKRLSRRTLSLITSFIFAFNFVILPLPSHAQGAAQPALNLPAVGTMVTTTPPYVPTLIKGITIHPDNALMFDFVFEDGDRPLEGEALKAEFEKLIKYFLAALTVPEKDLWVNLSPYEGGKVIPMGLGDTEMGRDLLAQDYLLKQLTASLMYPEQELGRKFWDKVFERAYELYGKTNIPLNTFNKVWIVPDKAVVLEQGRTALVVESHLKVMLEEDYAALEYSRDDEKFGLNRLEKKDADAITDVTSKIVREVLIPAIEEEVNNGETFANLRQIYHSMVLATWYKQSLKESLLGQVYVDQNKTQGVDTQDKEANQKIYAQYMEAFQKGVYDYIRHDYDKNQKRMVQRKYFSGGVDWRKLTSPDVYQKKSISEFTTSALGEIGPQKLAEFSKLSQTVMATTADVKMTQEFNTAISERLRDLPVNDQKVFQEAVRTTAPRKIYTATTTLLEDPKAKDMPIKKAASPAKVDFKKIGDLMKKTFGFAPSSLGNDIREVPVRRPNPIRDTLKQLGFQLRRSSEIESFRGSSEQQTPRFEQHLVLAGDIAPVTVPLSDGRKTEINSMELELGKIIQSLGPQEAGQRPTGIVIHTASPEDFGEVLDRPYLADVVNPARVEPPRTYRNMFEDFGVNVRAEGTTSAIIVSGVGEQKNYSLDIKRPDPGVAYTNALNEAMERAAVNTSTGETTPIMLFGEDVSGIDQQKIDTFLRYMEESPEAPAILGVLQQTETGDEIRTVLINPNKLRVVQETMQNNSATASITDLIRPSFNSISQRGSATVLQGDLGRTVIDGADAINAIAMNNTEVRNALAKQGIEGVVGYVDIGASARPAALPHSLADAFSKAFSPLEVLNATGQLQIDHKVFEVTPTVSLEYVDLTTRDSNNNSQPYTHEQITQSFGVTGWKAPETLEALVVQGNPVVFSVSEGPSFWDKMEGVRIDNQVIGEPLDLGSPDIAQQLDAQLGTGNISVASITITPNKEVHVVSVPSVDKLTESSAGSPVVEKPDGTGGIDFNAAMLHLQIKRDGAGVPLPISNQPVGEMNIQGFVPVILDIQTAPAAPAPLILGEAEPPTEELSRVAD